VPARVDPHAAPGTSGRVLRNALRYDLLLWLITFGKERRFREQVLDLVALVPGESVLDVGCGTGTMAIAAKRRVGKSGCIYGVDASLEMITWADRKARKARVDVTFKNGLAEALPFPDARFDVVLSTIMLHHFPSKARRQAVDEMRRVLKPGGRILVVDFEGDAEQNTKHLFKTFHRRRHGHVKARDVVEIIGEAGFNIVDSGAVGIGDLHFTIATAR